MRKNTRKKQKTFRRTKLRQRGGEPTLESLAANMTPPPTLTSMPPSPPSKRYLKVTFKNKGNGNNSNSNNNDDDDDSLIVVEIVTDVVCDNQNTYKNDNNSNKSAFAQFLDDYNELANPLAIELVSASKPKPPETTLFLPIDDMYDKNKEITNNVINWNGDCS
jgi:hypothetical protein